MAILTLPHVATRDAYDRLAARGESPHMVVLDGPAPDRGSIPFQDPNTVQGVCFFDLTKAPVRVRTHVEEGRLLTLSFRTREGRVFYAMTDRAALRDTIDIRLVNEAQLGLVEAGDDEDQGLPSELRLRAPSTRGLIVATALALRAADRDDAEIRIRAIDCHPEPLGTP